MGREMRRGLTLCLPVLLSVTLLAWLTNRFRYLDGVIRNYPIHS